MNNKEVGIVERGRMYCPVCRAHEPFMPAEGRMVQCMNGHRFTPPQKEEPHANCSYCGRFTFTAVRGWFRKYVECGKCGCRGPRMSTREGALRAWGEIHGSRSG